MENDKFESEGEDVNYASMDKVMDIINGGILPVFDTEKSLIKPEFKPYIPESSSPSLLKNINKFLDVFKKEISKVFDNNLVLAGSNVLLLHGLKLSWTPEDLDVVIYLPTGKQLHKIIDSKEYEPCIEYEKAEELGIPQRSWKKEKDGLTLNFILEYNTSQPETSLLYLYDHRLYYVNTIETIINAKLSYSAGEQKNLIRAKDAWHLSELKNNNFNAVKPLPKETK